MDQKVRLLYTLMLDSDGKHASIENLSGGLTVHKTGDLYLVDHIFNNSMIKFIKDCGVKIKKKKPIFNVFVSGNISIMGNTFFGNNMKAPWLAIEPTCK